MAFAEELAVVHVELQELSDARNFSAFMELYHSPRTFNLRSRLETFKAEFGNAGGPRSYFRALRSYFRALRMRILTRGQ